ncbi:MAG: hypothetical protein R3185_04270 [Candidatus Thermoplasmatota archaeon]|nr:hypothetical protein [Candidatus Thermoplasmatota archaeon]
MGAFDFLDISQLEVSEVVYLALALTVAFTVLSLVIAWVYRKVRK